MNIYKNNVFSLFSNNKTIVIKNRLVLAYGIAKGLCFLSSKGIVHRDFKPHNVLIDNTMNPKIIDFGSSAAKHNSAAVKVYDERCKIPYIFSAIYNRVSYSFRFINSKHKIKIQQIEL